MNIQLNNSVSRFFTSENKRRLISALLFGGMMVFATDSFAADPVVGSNIVGEAAKEIKTLLTGDGRQVIALGMICGGAFLSLMKSSWVPVVGSGFGVAIFEVLMGVAGK